MLLPILLSVYFLLPASQSESGYIECVPGTLNVILGAPHGGYEEPEGIPDREFGCYNATSSQCIWTHGCGIQSEEECDVTTVRDAYTKELTELLADNLENLTSKRPHVAISNLHRKKLDPNREIGEAALGEAIPEEAYGEFHLCLEEARAAIKADDCVEGTGLFLDIHGHGHPNDWAELGYLIYGSRLDSGDFDADDTSIAYLLSRSPLPFEVVFRGNQSFGHFIEEEGYASVPSPMNNGPDGDSYFSGGYNTRVHGSRDGGTIDGIQIESARVYRDPPERTAYAAALARAVVNFLDAHYTTCEDVSSSSAATTDRTDEPGVTEEVGTTDESSTEGSAAVMATSKSLLWLSLCITLVRLLKH